jgi:hypothetical protein
MEQSDDHAEFMNRVLGPDNTKIFNDMIEEYHSNKNAELEIAFKDIGLSDKIAILNRYIKTIDKKNILVELTLDINITIKKNVVFRITYYGDEINNFQNAIDGLNSSKIIDYLNKVTESDNIKFMSKDRSHIPIIRCDELNCSIKVSTENTKVTKPKFEYTSNIVYRIKDRITFNFDNHKIDITDVRHSNTMENIVEKNAIHEIELEFTNNKIKKNNIYSIIYDTVKNIQDSQIPFTKTEYTEIIQKYMKLLDTNNSTHLIARKSISLESIHITKFVPSNYGCTDKADGERHFILLLSSGIYLLTQNLVMKKTNLKPKKEYINTILDGELISDPYSFWIFDVVIYCGNNYSNNKEYDLTKRIKIINEIVHKNFGTFVDFEDFITTKQDATLPSIQKYYKDNLVKYWKIVCSDIKKSKTLYVNRKLQFIPYGLHPCEIFMYADLIWKMYVYKSLTPYSLDGIIYTPIKLPYNIMIEPTIYDTMPLEYKWKKPEHNTIDFFIKFIRNDNGETAVFKDAKSGIKYITVKLMVGKTNHGEHEKPVPFVIDNEPQMANITIEGGKPKDIHGGLILSHTVVEFMYNRNNSDNYFKWVPIRTRYDKTESVRQGKGRYGNPLRIALRVWNTIVNPITEEIISALGNESTYDKEFTSLQNTNKKSDKKPYYSSITNLAKEMRAFHNFIKSGMISSYTKKGGKAIDIGCGKGGDLLKLLGTNINFLVCTDVDNDGLFTIEDAAVRRYKDYLKNHPDAPEVKFINADARGLYKGSVQKKILINMSEENMNMIDKYLSGKYKFDTINCQFTAHYYMSDEDSWMTFLKNLSNVSEKGCNVLMTVFDGDKLFDMLKNKNNIEISYDNEQGIKTTLFDIKKMYGDKEKPHIGMGINVYNSIITGTNTMTYVKEYLVFKSILVETMGKHGFELVETESFENVYKTHEEYFTSVKSRPNLPWFSKINTFYEVVKNKYKSNKMNSQVGEILSTYEYSMLNRYYVFRYTKNSIMEPGRIIGANGQLLENLVTPYFVKYNMRIEKSYENNNLHLMWKNMKENKLVHNPNVYLIKHIIVPSESRDSFNENIIKYEMLKNNSSNKSVILYKSPDKNYYPIIDGNTFEYEFDDKNVKQNMTFFINITKIMNSIKY